MSAVSEGVTCVDRVLRRHAEHLHRPLDDELAASIDEALAQLHALYELVVFR